MLRIDPDDIHDEYDRAGLADLSDAQLFDLAAHVIAVPKGPAANSFVLHAPLELMARRLLLPLVPPERRRRVRGRMIWVAASYESTSEPVEPPEALTFGSVDAARRARSSTQSRRATSTVSTPPHPGSSKPRTLDEAMALAGPTLDMLAAAGHAPIALCLLSRTALTSRSSFMLLRPLLRELARAPDLRMQWICAAAPPHGDEANLIAALASTPRLGIPGRDFVYPIVHQVDDSGIAAT